MQLPRWWSLTSLHVLLRLLSILNRFSDVQISTPPFSSIERLIRDNLTNDTDRPISANWVPLNCLPLAYSGMALRCTMMD